jgi:hypothetical protein
LQDVKRILHFEVGNSGHFSSFGFNISKTGTDSKQRCTYFLKRDAKKRRILAAADVGGTRIAGVGSAIGQRERFLNG